MTLPTRFLLAAALLALPAAAPAQSTATPDGHPVMQVVTKLFDAMRARDTAAMRAAFADHAMLASWSEREGQARLGNDSLSAFLTSVANAPKDLLLDERIYHPQVAVSDGLASVWVEYDFYAGPRFSHCGVDAFHLARTAAGWKIVHLIDTRRRTDCPRRE